MIVVEEPRLCLFCVYQWCEMVFGSRSHCQTSRRPFWNTLVDNTGTDDNNHRYFAAEDVQSIQCSSFSVISSWYLAIPATRRRQWAATSSICMRQSSLRTLGISSWMPAPFDLTSYATSSNVISSEGLTCQR